MVCCLLHACLVCVLSVSVPLWVVFLLSFLCQSFFMYFGLVVCLPPLGKDTTLISFLYFTSRFL